MNLKRKNLLQQFKIEYSEYSHNLKMPKWIALLKYKLNIRHIIKLNYTNITIEFIDDGSFLFNIRFGDKYKALVNSDIIFTLWQGKKMIKLGYVTTKEAVRIIKREIGK